MSEFCFLPALLFICLRVWVKVSFRGLLEATCNIVASWHEEMWQIVGTPASSMNASHIMDSLSLQDLMLRRLMLPRKQNLHKVWNFSFCKLTFCGNVLHFCDTVYVCFSLLWVILFQNSCCFPQVTILMLVCLKSLTPRRYVTAPKSMYGHQS